VADKKKKNVKKTNNSGNSKQKQIKIERSEIIRWVVGFIAFFIILTFIPAINNGWFGNLIATFLKGLFGPMYYVVPFLILVIDIFWGRDHANNVARVKYIIYALEFIFISIFVQILVAGSEEPALNQLYSQGIELKSAGLISGSIAMLFTVTIGTTASMVLAILGIFICTVLLCGATPKDTVMAIVNYFRDAAKRAKEAREEEEEEEEPEIPTPRRKKKAEEAKAELPVALPEDPALEEEKPEFETISEYDAATDTELTPDPLEPIVAEAATEPEEAVAESSSPETIPEIIEETEEVEDEEDEELCLEPIEDTPYVFPPISLLTADSGNGMGGPSGAEVERTSRKLEEVLASFNVKAKVINSTYGPTVTRYELQPETGVRVKAISNLADDIALHLAATAVRIENIPGKAAVGVEIPNKATSTVRLRGLIDNPIFRDNKSRLFCSLGEDVAGSPVYLDIAKMPHLLVAGATGQGKSVCINSLIISLLYRNHPNDVKLILIDPKTVEFSDYKDIPHLLVPVINDPKNAAGTLNWACSEMEKRYRLIQEVGARDLMGYNNAVANDPERELLPQIVIFIDEFADLMMTAPDDVETSVCRLAQKARAAGIHLVIGTQRPSVDVITGLIKANIPSRIALTTTSAVDSRTILDMTGAEKLLGKGDMLYYPVGAMKPIRVQGAFVDGKGEVAAVTQFIKEAAQAQYDDAIMQQIEQEAKLCGMKGKKGAAAAAEADDGDDKTDPMFMDAIEVAIESGTVSTSLLQRRLSLGYARAARIIDKMERRGYIGEFDAATKKRNILITREQFAELKLNGETKKESENG
jgi:S-DNA-T family DNA segregation ATPase FtsK/SpoIIIE